MSRYVTLVWKKNKIVNVSFYAESCQITVFTNSAGFLIRCMRLFDAIREELVPYGTQTFPSVASACLHLIDGILAASVQCCCYDLSAENICMKFLFQLEGWLYNSHPPRIGSPATAGSATFRGLLRRAQRSPKFIPLVTYLLLQYNCKKH